MLQVISLHTINKIFEIESFQEVSAMARFAYITILNYYFEGMEPSIENNVGFTIHRDNIPNPDSKYFGELEEAGLIVIDRDKSQINVLNKWGNHINKSLLSKPTPEEYLARQANKSVVDFENYLLTSVSVFDLFGMRYKLSPDKITEMIKDFIAEKKAANTRYYSESECATHCINWFNKRMQNVPKNQQKGSGKILGL